ncbi:hypothetical protein pEaSNUABM50_00465 [Erwinia phage pEa_SNUABM_50]|uniref:ART-PolyVal-like domain-containing protein n=4 Tax=Eneladusvirus BF TaxID=2560751 RepID=A0A7L8ZN92_9CAUD|nr:hypothetical protein FDH34_gp467 [Serratia phage BF]QOI71391.1 hypothetical protein pEaSNUABM12_00470 [Erwinia phage pEa_SNUABM_12]QOI71933.1 hypothetical protein pEaSNUABM47_00466 [Erwinia phage pEa_SNUABM_47]QOI72473.1 hypothetical protein pEaSNUABM50_00465 [Erwinia phage pEa_SNUABM_50]QXO11600.1 hypothetical protein pEaSNUABM19_00471 [Erwinia phage pEa_SNUABM_19]QXO12148.1 hypothetical protein pEaSNUABM44_00469 [Erwinia phage pEa_SNUABM_44]QXO12702.1 hypothetical protein pEaSNUABM49_004
MEMKKLMEDISAIMEGQLPGYYYHGSSAPISNFSDEFVGRGNDEYGPGIYFSSVPNTSIGYAKDGGSNGMVYQCEINLRKELSKKTRVNKAVLLKLMQNTPDEDAYTNWNENKNVAYRTALQGYVDEGNMYDALMGVWYDWYREYPVQFVRSLVQLGYDGYIYTFASGERFIIVYNPASIKVVNTFNPEEAMQKLIGSE